MFEVAVDFLVELIEDMFRYIFYKIEIFLDIFSLKPKLTHRAIEYMLIFLILAELILGVALIRSAALL